MEPGKEQAQPSASLAVRMLICGARKRTSSVICFANHADCEDAVSGVRKRTGSAICFAGRADREDAELTVRMPICGARKRTVSVICFADHADRGDADLWSQEKDKLSHLLR